jgi:hypothetical protein
MVPFRADDCGMGGFPRRPRSRPDIQATNLPDSPTPAGQSNSRRDEIEGGAVGPRRIRLTLVPDRSVLHGNSVAAMPSAHITASGRHAAVLPGVLDAC